MAFLPSTGHFPSVSIGVMASLTLTKGSLVKFDATAGYIEAAASNGTALFGVLAEDVTSTSTNGETKALVWPIEFNLAQKWVADTSGTPTEAQKGDIVKLESTTQVDEDSSGAGTAGVVLHSIQYPASGKKVIVSFDGNTFTTHSS